MTVIRWNFNLFYRLSTNNMKSEKRFSGRSVRIVLVYPRSIWCDTHFMHFVYFLVAMIISTRCAAIRPTFSVSEAPYDGSMQLCLYKSTCIYDERTRRTEMHWRPQAVVAEENLMTGIFQLPLYHNRLGLFWKDSLVVPAVWLKNVFVISLLCYFCFVVKCNQINMSFSCHSVPLSFVCIVSMMPVICLLFV